MDIINILKNIPIFQGMNDKDYLEIVPLLDMIVFPKKTLLMKEGTEGSSMYILLSGSVKVTKTLNQKEEIVLSILTPGSYFGELSLLDNLPRSANVETLEDSKLFHLKKTNFDKLIKANMNIANVFYKNCLNETFFRFRNVVKNFTFSQHVLKETTETLEEINKDLSLAKEVQHYFINTEMLDSEESLPRGIKHQYKYLPCIEVGGDFLNVVRLNDDRIGIIIADVVGHGVTSAMATGILKSAFSFYVKDYALEPAKLMDAMNRHYYEIMAKYYATCYYAVIDPEKGKLMVAKGGHHHPLLWKKSEGDYLPIECGGIGIGISDIAKYDQCEISVEKGDMVFFYTDGIIEQRNKDNEMYSEFRLREKLRELIKEKRENILDGLIEDLRNFTGDIKYEDDITLLLIEI